MLLLLKVSAFVVILMGFTSAFAPTHRLRVLEVGQGQKGARKQNTHLQLIDEEDRPKLTYQDDNNGPRVSVKDLDEVTGRKEIQKTSTPTSAYKPIPKQTSTFGTLSADELRSKWVPKDMPVKKNFIAAKEDLNGIQPLESVISVITFDII
jgi:hypothetical protein